MSNEQDAIVLVDVESIDVTLKSLACEMEKSSADGNNARTNDDDDDDEPDVLFGGTVGEDAERRAMRAW